MKDKGPKRPRYHMAAQLLWIPAGTFFLCLAVGPLVRALALRVGLVDRPDGRRKLQHQAVPVAGGLAILASAAAVLAAALLFRAPDGPRVIEPSRLLGLFLGSL